MKKLLLLAGILVVGSVAFGAESLQGVDGASATSDITVQAEVIDDLEILVSDNGVVDFGTMVINQQDKGAVTTPTVTVNGDPGRNIKLSVKLQDGAAETTLGDVGQAGFPVELKNGDVVGVNSTLTFKNDSGSYVENEYNALDENGSFGFKIDGTADALDQTGKFTNVITIKAQYE